MSINQILTNLKKYRLLALAVLVAAVCIGGYLGWHKHQADNLKAQQQLDLGVQNAQSLPVAFLSEYGQLQGKLGQQKNLVANYGTASFINNYHPVKKGAVDPLLCNTRTLSAVSSVITQPVKANTISTLALRYSDGTPGQVDVQVNSQLNGLKINSVSCIPSHAGVKPVIKTLGPNLPVQVVTP